jgi:hypothetical protein
MDFAGRFFTRWIAQHCCVLALSVSIFGLAKAEEQLAVDSVRDTLSPVHAWEHFPYTWAELRAGQFTLLPTRWQRHAASPVISQGMNARPVVTDENTVRVYYGKRGKGGGICYFDVDPRQPEKLLAKPAGPIITTGEAGSYDDDWVLCPEPVRVSDSHLRMYYAAKKTGGFFNKVWSLACADSHDNGETWTKYAGNPIMTATDDEWESGAVGFTSVEHDEHGWRMWYLGTDTSSNATKQIGYATSEDGLKWERYAKNPVIGVDPANHWEKGAIAVARMIRDGKLIRTWYCCYPQNNTYAIGCAESVDGITWTRSPGNPILQGSGKGWDSAMTAYPGTVRVGDRYLMWYSGNGYGNSGIGLATAEVPKGTLLYRTGQNDKPDESWSAWQMLDDNEPARAGKIQFAVIAPEK